MILYYFIGLLINLVSCENWNEGDTPGVAMEYKVHIDPKKEDCYWQYVHPGATIYVNTQVIKGGDLKIGVAVRNPQNVIVHPYSWDQSIEFEEVSQNGGYYSVCLDNQFAKFTGKLVSLYITTFRYDLWEKYTKELEDLDVGVNNFTESLKNVDHKINEMLQFQSLSRSKERRDYELLMDNGNYIYYWSLAQCLAITVTSLIQVYSVRNLFQEKKGTKSGLKA